VDLRVVQVYKEFKLSGKGIRVVVLDDGLQHDHPDINKNYVRSLLMGCFMSSI
jgi:tetraacyldisaccharide-1-P 4'-kinase